MRLYEELLVSASSIESTNVSIIIQPKKILVKIC